MPSMREVEQIIAENDTLFGYLETFIYDNPDIFEEDPRARAAIFKVLSSITPEPAYDDGHPISRGQQRSDLTGHERGFTSWSGNIGVAKQFASNFYSGVIVQSTGPVQGVKWENIIDHRMRARPEESWYSGNHAEWFVINPPEVNIVERKTPMTKPFRAYLTEQEQDYEYKLYSIENIHSPAMLDQIRLALGRYGLISLEPAGVQTQVKPASDSQFADYPFTPIFIIKVVLSNPLSSNPAVQSVALFTRINSKYLRFIDKDDKVVMDGADGEQHAHPVEVDGKGAQAEVGDAHARTLVSDLMKEIEASRKAKTVEIPVYEGQVASHHEVGQLFGVKVRRGFYLIENHGTGTGVITGPFKKCPDNYDYIGKLPAIKISEQYDMSEQALVQGIVEYKVEFAQTDQQTDPADGGDRKVGKSMEVEVTDQDTGKVYTAVVRANSNSAARTSAVEIIAARTGFGKERLIATNPVADAN